MNQIEIMTRALERIEAFATGWPHGHEGERLLAIQDIARPHVCGHAPAILHRTGGASAEEQNTCGKCGRMIRTIGGAWVTDYERENA